jgi:hypothetical protein
MVIKIYVETVADLHAFTTFINTERFYVRNIFMMKQFDFDILKNLRIFRPWNRKKRLLEYRRSAHLYVALASV